MGGRAEGGADGLKRVLEFMADQQAGEIVGDRHVRQTIEQPERPGTEEMLQQPAREGPGGVGATLEGAVVLRVIAVRHEAAENGVILQDGEQLTGHEGGEPLDLPVLDQDPF